MSMKRISGLELAFSVTAPQGVISALPAFKAEITDGRLTVSVGYAGARGDSLSLNARVTCPAKVRVRLLAYRIELWVNDRLCDEEWPYGECLVDENCRFTGDFAVSLARFYEDLPPEPGVLSTFTNAAGWQPENDVFVGDCMPYVHGGRYHVLYLKDRHHHKSKWGLGAHQWEHISSADFASWDVHPMAVEITDPKEGSICTGSWIENGGAEYLYYTVRTTDGSPAPICRSVSKDGLHFEKDSGFAFTLSPRYKGASARDPKLIRDENGLFHMLVTTSLVNEKRGCLAHLISSDLSVWKEEDAPIYISKDGTEPECPDYIAFGGHYYLIYSLHGSAHYLYSSKPFEGWQEPKQPVIPCESVPKGAVWQNKLVFAGFSRIEGYAGKMTFRTAAAAPSGELVFD